MKPCSGCRRHLRRGETLCPFCGAALREAPAPLLWGLGVAVMTAACGPGRPPEDDATTDDSGTGSDALDPTSAGASTQGPSTFDPTTGAGSTSTSTVTGDPDTTDCGSACTDSSEAGGFIYGAPDGSDGVTECDNWAQDCPAGQKCAATTEHSSWDSLRCVPVVPDPHQPGDPCVMLGADDSGVDSCDLGAMCWSVGADDTGTCVALCTGAPGSPTCAPESTCALLNGGVLNLCLPGCDPLLQDCPGDDLCVPNQGAIGFVCLPDASGAEGQQHDGCDALNGCDPGLTCMASVTAVECDQDVPNCCQPFCALSEGDAQCSGAGQVCAAWFEAGQAPPGLEDVGACTVQ